MFSDFGSNFLELSVSMDMAVAYPDFVLQVYEINDKSYFSGNNRVSAWVLLHSWSRKDIHSTLQIESHNTYKAVFKIDNKKY